MWSMVSKAVERSNKVRAVALPIIFLFVENQFGVSKGITTLMLFYLGKIGKQK